LPLVEEHDEEIPNRVEFRVYQEHDRVLKGDCTPNERQGTHDSWGSYYNKKAGGKLIR